MWNIPHLQKFVDKLPKPEKVSISNSMRHFAVVGGTFDRLHMGHKTLIYTALANSKKLLLCVTTDEYVRELRKIAGDIIEPFENRIANIKQFLRSLDVEERVSICELEDPFSPAIHGKHARDLDAIIISEDPYVYSRTLRLNTYRLANKLGPLEILRIPLLLDPYRKPFSSTRYRLNDYFPEPRPPKFILNQDIVEEIRKPKGVLIDSPRQLPEPSDFVEKGIIVIGDKAFLSMVREGYPISVAIIDYQANRSPLEYRIIRSKKDSVTDVAPVIPLVNEPSTISTFAWFVILVAYVQRNFVAVGVKGEEDLLAFPATLLAPTGALIVYGDPFRNKMVYFIVEDDVKEDAMGLLEKMKKQ